MATGLLSKRASSSSRDNDWREISIALRMPLFWEIENAAPRNRLRCQSSTSRGLNVLLTQAYELFPLAFIQKSSSRDSKPIQIFADQKDVLIGHIEAIYLCPWDM